ncbi:hypothetical protein SUGI_0336470 [Cryptomeria japonica]|uniref:vesicle-associated protein 4-1 n=1 Tax=Cryptomeria japonica TaxID=3369 RepID=UPI002408A62D|nr:vesicle-associated protein 4-1 [Cryptomeria japonica]GLJ18836.1 hypothetical protein SUGI_0336470 [Cryptomeria japonica]
MGAKKSSKSWKLFGMPFWNNPSEPEDTQPIVNQYHNHNNNNGDNSNPSNRRQRSFATMARASLLTWRSLSLNPDKKLFFLYEPGKQVSSAVRIKNVSRSYVAFKFQTNAPKSCFMRPPNGVLAPKESILASVVKFVEQPDHPDEKKTTKDKFKIVSLKVKQGTEYSPELFEEHKDLVFVERVLRVVFLDPERPSQELEKLKKRLAEAEAIKQAQKTPQDDKAAISAAPAEGVIDEWKERRERYLARHQDEVVDSL